MEKVILRRKRRSVKLPKGLTPFAVTVSVVLLTVIINSMIGRPLVLAARDRLTSAAVTVMNEAAAEAVTEMGSFDVLSVREAGSESFIINADTAFLNGIITLITAKADAKLEALGVRGASVDLGTVSGIAVFSGRGPKIEIEFTPTGSVQAKAKSSLISSGINQSLFSIDLDLTVGLRLLLVGQDEEITVKSTVPIAETVIVGKTPQVYTNVANEEDMLNLIPTDVP